MYPKCVCVCLCVCACYVCLLCVMCVYVYGVYCCVHEMYVCIQSVLMCMCMLSVFVVCYVCSWAWRYVALCSCVCVYMCVRVHVQLMSDVLLHCSSRTFTEAGSLFGPGVYRGSQISHPAPLVGDWNSSPRACWLSSLFRAISPAHLSLRPASVNPHITGAMLFTEHSQPAWSSPVLSPPGPSQVRVQQDLPSYR